MAKFQISPNVQIVVGAIVAVLTLGSKGAIQLPAGIPTSWGPIIDSWSTFILQIYSVIAPIMLAYTSSQPGPLAPPDSPAVKTLMAKENAAAKSAASLVSALLIGFLALVALSLVAPSTALAAGAPLNLAPHHVVKHAAVMGACGRGGCAPSPVAPTPNNGGGGLVVTSSSTLKDSLTKIAGDESSVIAQLQAIDWYAQQIIPGSNPPKMWDPYAHQCMPAAEQFISTTPTQLSTPTPPPDLASGPLVAFEVARLNVIALDDFSNSISQHGFPDYLQIGCAAYLQNIKTLPFKLTTDITTNLTGLFSMLATIVGG